MNREKLVAEIEENHSTIVETFSPLAIEIANQSIGTRAGFGAFRKYESLSDNSIRLVNESGFFLPPQQKVGEPWFWILDPEYFHFFFRKAYPRQNFRHFINRVLANLLYFNPFCVWALFWALAKAEHQFLFRFIPFWSHEERLTGHFVSQIIERIEEFKPHWTSLDSYQFPNSASFFEIYYADTASGRRESTTGADFGLVVHGIFPNQKEFFKVVRFQAKKVGKSGKARINIPQAFSLMEKDELGYYLFYHFLDDKTWSLAPTVQKASYFKFEIEKAMKGEEEEKPQKQVDALSVSVRDDGYDFATFTTFALSDPSSEHGLIASTPSEAVNFLMYSTKELPHPSRVIIITLGMPKSEIDWRDVLGEYIGYQFGDEE